MENTPAAKPAAKRSADAEDKLDEKAAVEGKISIKIKMLELKQTNFKISGLKQLLSQFNLINNQEIDSLKVLQAKKILEEYTCNKVKRSFDPSS